MSSSPIAWLLLVAAVVFNLMQWRKVRLGADSNRWKLIKCRIVKVKIDEEKACEKPDSPIYSAKIEYSYKISSVVYHSTCLTYQPTSGLTFERAVSLIAGVLPGSEATAYYNPRNKAQAVLIRTTDTGNAVPFVLSGLFVVLLATWILTHRSGA